MQNDEMMNELSKETENGRLLRILVKLGMMNERPENDTDPGWSETGDRYLLKLFRDFVFHQVCPPLHFLTFHFNRLHSCM